ncbi:ABC transporter permease [Paludibaculum fermentans]|uniref:ABC transporter permease n=1 Tax=Paludibaculum fermentans TaxID=1473598 RepID=UPI003EBFBAE3
MRPVSTDSQRPVAMTLRLYRALERAFPHEFRNVYGDELLQAAEDLVEPVWRRHGVAGLLRLLLDLAWRVPVEYAAELRYDARHGVRKLAGSPGFTAVALTSITLGVCIATCAYSEMNGLLRDLPGVPAPEQLVSLQAPVSYPAYRRYRELPNLFAGSFAYVAPVPFGVQSGARTERVWGHLVTAGYFSTLGARPMFGRFLDESDAQPGLAPVAVVSFRYWKLHLGSDPSVVGRRLRVNGGTCTIVGVAAEEFLGASPTIFPADVWLPVTVDARLAPEMGKDALERRDLSMFQMVGRLKQGTSEASAQAELNAAAQRWADSYGDADRHQKGLRVQLMGGGKILPLRKQDVPFFKEFLMVLGGLLLLIACANVANMMLARAVDRRKEISVRLSLGASRARLIRQLLTESVLLSVASAPPALLLSYWLMHALSQLKMPLPIPVGFDLTPDWHALLFTFAATGLAGLAFGLAPAFQATRTDLVQALKGSGGLRAEMRRVPRLKNGLMLLQMAASLTLLLMTGYLGIGIQSTLGVQEGFDPRNLYMVSLDPVRDGYAPERAADFLEKLLERVKSKRGVISASLTDTLPVSLDGNAGIRFLNADSSEDGRRAANWARKHTVGRGYFETVGIRILSGRGFQRQDERAGASAVIVSQEAVRRIWNGADPVGRRIELGNAAAQGGFGAMPGTIDFRASALSAAPVTYEVVGVAGDVSEDLVASKKHSAVYFPLRPADHAQPSLRGVTLLVRGAPGVDVISAVEREIASLDTRVTPFHASSMMEHISQFMSMLKAASWTYGLIGLFGLVLAAVGLAGVTAYSVAKRSREIGIRLALGAQKRDVLALVMKEGALMVLLGTAVGLALSIAGIRGLSGVFFTVASVQGYDPMLLIGAPALLAGLALLACYVPARRSTSIDPAVTLRSE